jgi:hypothetical protein
VIADLETCEVVDASGAKLAIGIKAERRIPITIHCGCFRHSARDFTVLVTPGGAYVRADINDGFYRDTDVSGPITVEIPSPKQQQTKKAK